MSKDFNIPTEFTVEQRKVAETIIKIAKETFGKTSSGGGCRAFYSTKEWKERGEDYGTESEFIICHDGGDLAPFFNWDYCSYDSVEKMINQLKDLGYRVEQCTSWYSAVYKD